MVFVAEAFIKRGEAMGYIEENINSYEKIYQKGWGNRYPDSSIISYYFHYIKPLIGVTGRRPKMLDFGCSLGANTKFFADQGFEVYGIDISETVIEKCITMNSFDRNHFKVCNILGEGIGLKELFGTDFDLIVASDVLYYFSKEDAHLVLNMFNEALQDQGVIYANWVTCNHYVYEKYKRNPGEQIRVSNTENIDETLNVYVLEDKQEMEELFDMFQKKHIKATTIEYESTNESLHYIGIKGLYGVEGGKA